MSLRLLRYLNFQHPTPTTTFCSPSFLSCQFPVPLSSHLAKARRIQLSDFYTPRVLLEKITQPGRLEPLSITGPQCQLGFQCCLITCSSTVKDGSKEAYTIRGIIFIFFIYLFFHGIIFKRIIHNYSYKVRYKIGH